MALIAGCLWFANEATFPFPWAIAAVLGSLGVIDLVTRSQRMNANRRNPICRSGLTMSRDYLLHYRQPVLDAEIALSRRHEHVYVWDPFDVLCPRAKCQAVVNRKPLFFDADHLSAEGNRAVYPDFVAFLKTHLDR